MDLDALRSQVRTMTLVETDDVSDAVLLDFLNQGLYELSIRFRWPFLEEATVHQFSVTASTQAYALPADYRSLIAIVDSGTSNRLTRITVESALERWADDPPESDPAEWYFVYGGNVNFVPVPATTEANAYKMYYRKGITVLVSGSDTPEFEAEFHHVLIPYAVARVWEREEDFDKAAEADRKFDQAVEMMARYYLKRVEDYPLIYGDGPRPKMFGSNTPFLDDGALAGW